MEFATPTFNVLNALEQMGYKVVTSGAFVTGHNKFDQVRTSYMYCKSWPLCCVSCLLPASPMCQCETDWTFTLEGAPRVHARLPVLPSEARTRDSLISAFNGSAN